MKTINKASTDTEKRAIARQLLQDVHTTATGCFKAAELLCDSTFRTWEPESIWLTLERAGVDIPVLNRDKLLAAITLTVIPAFWFEINAFENTVMAFNDIVSDYEILQEATPGQISWAVLEAELLYSQMSDIEETTEFDYEPINYTAIVLNRAGFILAPELLHFSQSALDKLNNDGINVDKDKLRIRWNDIKTKDLTKIVYENTPFDTQLAHLAAVQLYIQERLEQYQKDVDQLNV